VNFATILSISAELRSALVNVEAWANAAAVLANKRVRIQSNLIVFDLGLASEANK
jgi:hypothetical protein